MNSANTTRHRAQLYTIFTARHDLRAPKRTIKHCCSPTCYIELIKIKFSKLQLDMLKMADLSDILFLCHSSLYEQDIPYAG